MSGSYAEQLEAAKRNAVTSAKSNAKEKKHRDAGLAADIAAELEGALTPEESLDHDVPASDAVSAPVVYRAPQSVPAPAAPEDRDADFPGSSATDVPPSEPAATTKARPSTVIPPTPDSSSARREPGADDNGAAIVRQGVDFRRAQLDLITEMLYRCHRQKIRLPGKKGPSIIVRAALDELAAVYAEDPERFDEIMFRYGGKRSQSA